jgi:hypothetical protein
VRQRSAPVVAGQGEGVLVGQTRVGSRVGWLGTGSGKAYAVTKGGLALVENMLDGGEAV